MRILSASQRDTFRPADAHAVAHAERLSGRFDDTFQHEEVDAVIGAVQFVIRCLLYTSDAADE